MKRSILTKIVAVMAIVCAVVGLASCNNNKNDSNWGVDNSGKVLNIYCWNEEFRGFFNRYITDEGKALLAKGELMDDTAKVAKTGYHVDGIAVVFNEYASSDGVYQSSLDLALDAQATAKADDKVDLFLAEADYILKYADDDATQDIKALGVTDMSQTYEYTVQAASDSNGVVKGVSFQCCPSALIYNRTIARAVWGTDDPEIIGEKLNTWEKFDNAAVEVKNKGYLMTACEAETYRVFSNNASSKWVDDNDNLTIPAEIQQWMTQAENYVKNGYTESSDVWGSIKTENIAAGSTSALCCFGPAWYYNFCMGGSESGDWAIVEGPQAHFWGGTWLMAAAGSDNTDLVAKVMNAFINDTTVETYLIKNEGQFTNNQAANAAVANDPNYAGNTFLGGQNDTKLFLELAKNIKFENISVYDQLCNEGLQKYFREYLDGDVATKEEAMANFYSYIKTKYPNLKTPA